jgi:hypothetical protein
MEKVADRAARAEDAVLVEVAVEAGEAGIKRRALNLRKTMKRGSDGTE